MYICMYVHVHVSVPIWCKVFEELHVIGISTCIYVHLIPSCFYCLSDTMHVWYVYPCRFNVAFDRVNRTLCQRHMVVDEDSLLVYMDVFTSSSENVTFSTVFDPVANYTLRYSYVHVHLHYRSVYVPVRAWMCRHYTIRERRPTLYLSEQY